MQILHYCTHLQLTDGGVNQCVLDLATALSKHVKSVSLMSTEGTHWPHAGTGVQTMQTGPFDRSLNRFTSHRLATLQQYIDATDVLHIHHPWEPASVQLAKIAKECNTPFVVSARGDFDLFNQKKGVLNKLFTLFFSRESKWAYHNASAVHCASKQEAERVITMIPKARIKIVPRFFRPTDFLHPPPSSDPDKYWPVRETPRPIVFIHFTLNSEDDIKSMINTVSEVSTLQDIRFLVCGNGSKESDQSLHSVVAELGAGSRVECIGQIYGDRKISLLRVADIVVLQAYNDYSSNLMLEAMACGLPIITTKGGNQCPELESTTGLLEVRGDAVSIASAIAGLLEHAALQNQMGQTNRKWITDTYLSDVIVSKYVDFYRQVIT